MAKTMYIGNNQKRKRRGFKGFLVSFACLGLLVFVALNISPLKSILDATGDEGTVSLTGTGGSAPVESEQPETEQELIGQEPMGQERAEQEQAEQAPIGQEWAEQEQAGQAPMGQEQTERGQAEDETVSAGTEPAEGDIMSAGPEEAEDDIMSAGPEQAEDDIMSADQEQAESDTDTDSVSFEQAAQAPDPEELWRETFSAVPASAPVDESYFHDALFIGDSRVMSLMLYSGITDAVFYTEKGVNVTTLLTKPIVMQTGGTKITVPEALRSKKFGKIYIKTGINELGWRNTRMFAEAYGEVVDRIRELQPEAVIYIQSILPVARSKAEKDTVINNGRIAEFNELIKKMTWEKGILYLDVFQYMIDDEGYLPEDAGGDGVHLNKAYCRRWLTYLTEHTVRGNSGRRPSMIDAEERRGYRD